MSQLNYPPFQPSPNPQNSFYLDPQQEDFYKKLEEYWTKWEAEHPDDPDGSKYVAEYSSREESKPQRKTRKEIENSKSLVKRIERKWGEDKKYAQFYVPKKLASNFSNFCTSRGYFPAHVVQILMDKFIKNEIEL